MSEASKKGACFARRQKAGTIGHLIAPQIPSPTKDHRRANVIAIRQKERLIRNQKEQAEEHAGRESFKLKQFGNVPSRLHQTPQRSQSSCSSSDLACADACFSPPQRRPRSASTSTPVATPAAAPSPWARSPWRGLTPPPLDRAPQQHRGSRGSLLRNRDCPPSKPEPQYSDEHGISPDGFELAAKELGSPWLHRRHGNAQSPGLEARGSAWEPDAIVDARGDDDTPVPPGYRLMADQERVETLEELKRKLLELDDKYARLPLHIETEGPRRQQQALRLKIAETESAVSLFSRRKVLVEI